MKIMQKLKCIVKDKSGSSYLEMVIGVLVFSLALAFIIKAVPVLILKNQLNTFAGNISRIISVEGIYNSTVQDKIEEYRIATEIGEVTVSLDGTNFISGTEKIQLNDLIVVTVTTEYDMGFSNFGSFPITLSNTAKARSEAYWK